MVKCMKNSLRCIVQFLVWSVTAVNAAWQIEHTDEYIKRMRTLGNTVPKRIGNFSTPEECEEMIRRIVSETNGAVPASVMRVVGFYDQQSASEPSGRPTEDWGRQRAEQEAWAEQQAELARRQAEQARQQREKERAKQRKFEGERDQLADQLKLPSLDQLESVAGSSQEAGGAASAGLVEVARPQAEFVVSPTGGIPASSVSVPEPQASVARLKEYIAIETKIAEDRHAALLKELEAARKALTVAAERASRKESELEEVNDELATLVIPAEPPPELKEQRDSLEEEAKALLAEVEELNKKAQELRNKVDLVRHAEVAQFQRGEDLRKALSATEKEPEQAEAWLRKLREETP